MIDCWQSRRAQARSQPYQPGLSEVVTLVVRVCLISFALTILPTSSFVAAIYQGELNLYQWTFNLEVFTTMSSIKSWEGRSYKLCYQFRCSQTHAIIGDTLGGKRRRFKEEVERAEDGLSAVFIY